MELEEGQLLGGRFRLGARLGRSEIGESYAALDQTLARECALKVLVPSIAQAPAAWRAFQETCGKALGEAADAFNVASNFGLDSNLDRPFFASELIALPSLFELVHRHGAVPVDVWARVLRRVGDAFVSLRRADICHGDLKPQNLFFSPEAPETVRVSDLGMIGLRRARPPAHGPGSLGFCSLEELDGRVAPSPAGDVYALALVTFYALAGRHHCRAMWEPVPNASRVRQELGVPLISASRHAESIGGALPSELDGWFLRALDPDAARRFPTVLDAASAFGTATASYASTNSGDLALSPTIPAPPPERRERATLDGPGPTLDGAAPAGGGVPATIVDESLARAPKPISRKHLALAAGGASILTVAVVWGAWRSSPSSQPARVIAPTASSTSAATAGASAAEHAVASAPRPTPEASAPKPEPATRARLECRPVDCEFIVCDGRNIPENVREAAVAAGKHRCTGARYGYRSATVEFDVREGTTTDVVFQLAPGKAAAKSKPGAKKTSAKSPSTKTATNAKSTASKSGTPTAKRAAGAAPKTGAHVGAAKRTK